MIVCCSYSAGIPGDGRCLFRSVVHGARLREGKPSPGESYERELADELREKVRELYFYIKMSYILNQNSVCAFFVVKLL